MSNVSYTTVTTVSSAALTLSPFDGGEVAVKIGDQKQIVPYTSDFDFRWFDDSERARAMPSATDNRPGAALWRQNILKWFDA